MSCCCRKPNRYLGFRKGETVRGCRREVDNKNNNPKILVSRTSNEFLRRLFELEVPEIHDGLILIRAIARIPGERAKIAVESYDDRIDPVGACVGKVRVYMVLSGNCAMKIAMSLIIRLIHHCLYNAL